MTDPGKKISNDEALKDALRLNDVAEVKKLVETGRMDVGASIGKYKNWTPLHIAVSVSRNIESVEGKKRNREIIAYLLSRKAPLGLKDDANLTPLGYAKELDIAQMILSSLPDDAARKRYIDDSNGLIAAGTNNELFEHYIKMGADPCLRDAEGELWLTDCKEDCARLEKRLKALSTLQREKLLAMPGILGDMLDTPFLYDPKALMYMAERVPQQINRPNHRSLTLRDRVSQDLEDLEDAQSRKALSSEDEAKLEALRDMLPRLSSLGAKPSEVIIKKEAAAFPTVEGYLRGKLGKEEKILSIDSPQGADFASVPTLPSKTLHGPAVNILVVENGDVQHIHDTSYIANGVTSKLLGAGHGCETIPLFKNFDPNLQGLERYARLAGESKDVTTIISHSMTNIKGLATYSPPQNYFNKRRIENEPSVIFHSAGNEGDMEGYNFQDWNAAYHTRGIVNVGAASRLNSVLNQIEYYSQSGPFFLGPMLSHHGEKLSGTSFAAPYAAGLDAALTRRYGQWKKNPYGLTQEENLWVMAASADTNLLDSASAKPLDFNRRNDGVAFHERGGAGLLNPLDADALAQQLFSYKRRHHLTNAFVAQEIPIAVSIYVGPGPEHRYEIPIEKPVAANSLLLKVHLTAEKDDEGNILNAPQLIRGAIEYEGKRIPIVFSTEGESTVGGLIGASLPKDSKLTLITGTPIWSGSLTVRGTDATGVNPILTITQGLVEDAEGEIVLGGHKGTVKINGEWQYDAQNLPQRFTATSFTWTPEKGAPRKMMFDAPMVVTRGPLMEQMQSVRMLRNAMADKVEPRRVFMRALQNAKPKLPEEAPPSGKLPFEFKALNRDELRAALIKFSAVTAQGLDEALGALDDEKRYMAFSDNNGKMHVVIGIAQGGVFQIRSEGIYEQGQVQFKSVSRPQAVFKTDPQQILLPAEQVRLAGQFTALPSNAVVSPVVPGLPGMPLGNAMVR